MDTMIDRTRDLWCLCNSKDRGGNDKSENRLIRGYEELKFHYNRGIIEISFPLKIFLKYNS